MGVLGLVAPPLDLCKRKLNRTGCRVSIYNAKDLLSAKAQHYLMFPNPPSTVLQLLFYTNSSSLTRTHVSDEAMDSPNSDLHGNKPLVLTNSNALAPVLMESIFTII